MVQHLDEPTRQFRDALRLLFILARAGEPVGNPPPIANAARIIDSQKRLQKIDFWVRNPDHLSHALLDGYKITKNAQWLLTKCGKRGDGSNWPGAAQDDVRSNVGSWG